MIRKLSSACTRFMERYLPDAFLFAAILTVIVFVGAMLATGLGPVQMIRFWGDGFWALLAFSTQMALVVLLGSTMARSKPFEKLVKKIAKSCKTPLRAAFIITVFSAVAFWINWGIALVLGAMLAREIAREVKGVDYRLLIAMSYSGICITQGGIGGSITLQVALAGALSKIAPSVFVAADLIPITQTIFSPYNLVICALFAIIMPFVAVKMHPKAEETFEVDPAILADAKIEEKKLTYKEMTPAERIENSKIVWAIIVVLGFAYIVYHFVTKGFDLNINITNFILLMVGVLLHGPNLINYVKAIAASIHSVAGVMLQFPFYAGIMGMMIGTNGSGVSLASVLSNAFVAISTVKTFPYFTYLSAGIVNFFIPSGGGQWAVQGPIMMVAGDSLGVEPAKTVMAISYGDAWTNLIQPFWALPTLAVAKLKARDIMGYLVVALIVSFIITTFGLLVLA